MLPTFFGLNTVTRALLAQQEAIDVLNQNVSNANTQGYSRQTAVIQATDPYTAVAFDRPSLSGQLGQGASVTTINRAQDELLNSQIRFTNQSVGQLQVMNDAYTQIQAIYNDPSNVAINSAASNFFNSIHDLTNTPEDDSARQLVQQNGSTLANAISTRFQQLTTLQSDLNTKVSTIVRDINNDINQIATMNHAIAESTGIGDNANDLKDKRDALIDDLSTKVDVRVVQNPDGTDTIQMNGRFLVNKDQAYTLTTLTDASRTALIKPVQVFWQEDVTKFQNLYPGYDPVTGLNLTTNVSAGTNVSKAQVSTGQLAGALNIRDNVIQNTLLPQLNELSDALTNTQVLSSNTGLQASTQLTGSAALPDDFTVSVLTPQGTASPGPGQIAQYSIKSAQTASTSITGLGNIASTVASLAGINLTAGSTMTITEGNTSVTYTAAAGDTAQSMINYFNTHGFATLTGTLVSSGVAGDPQQVQLSDGTAMVITGVSGSIFSTLGFHQGTVQGAIDAINSSNVSPWVHASLNSAGQVQIDTIASGALVKVDGANGAAAKDFGFSASVADGFNLVHVQGWGLNTPPQWQGGISGLTLSSSINVGDRLQVVAPDGSTVNITVPPPSTNVYPPPTTTTVQALIDTINAKGLSHGFQAALDGSGHLTIFSTPTTYGQDGTLVGAPAQITGDNPVAITATTSLFSSAGNDTLTVQGPLGTVSYTAVAGDTVQTLMDKINSANIGVTASINSAGQFQLTSQKSGASQFIKLSGVTNTATDTMYATLGLGVPAGGSVQVNGLDHGFAPSSTLTVSANTTTALATTSVAGSPFAIGALNPPTGLGITLTGNTYTSPATITVNGTDATTGKAVTETISVTQDGTYSTSHAYSNVTSITLNNIAGGTISATPMNESDFFGDPTGVNLPKPVASTNTNQFFFDSASQSLQHQVLGATAIPSGAAQAVPSASITQLTSPSALTLSIFQATTATALTKANSFPIQVAVTGIDASTGTAVTETLKFQNPSQVLTTSHVFSSVTGITTTTSNGAYTTNSADLQITSSSAGTQYDTASTLVVDPTVIANPSVIAASSMPGINGNDVNALALLNVQQQAVVTNGQAAATLGDFYGSVTENLGGAAQQVNTNMTSEQQLVQHFTNQKQSVVGVSVDEEAANLLALQHAYQAAARAITAQDSMLDTIINGMGLVGRA